MTTRRTDSENAYRTTAEDGEVRGRRGTIATCTCGWRDAWGVQDGSAEASAYLHSLQHDPRKRAEHEERARQYFAGAEARDTENRRRAAESLARREPDVEPRQRCHDCSCHLDPPCSACENCAHMDGEIDCPNDCRDCTEHEDDLD